ncbi:MAG TPA: arsenic metallochaperone ArsD family protein [Methanocorpusculum sp.]|nr:arsenic metallochaperone ArsD family protein [Methanocorpusculum sp.]
MTSVEILDFAAPAAKSPEAARTQEVVEKLIEAGFAVALMPHTASQNASARALIEKKGTAVLPLTLVNGFAMIFGRYPANEELKQFLNVPDGILEPKECGCCCIEGCGDCGR